MLERDRIRNFKKLLRKKYSRHDVWFYNSCDRFTDGIPDIIMCFRGRFVGIEFKRDKNCQPDQMQIYNICAIKRAGGAAGCFWEPQDAINFIETL